ncbi:MAG TPA: sugar ABC transporter substrate-binding protein [Actinomycetota bacterium]
MTRLGLLLVAPLLAACAGGADGATDDAGTIDFMVFGDPEEIVAYENLIAAFEAREPDVDVNLIVTSDRDDLIARLSTSFAGGQPPDLFLMNYRYYGQFATRGVLEPLGPYLEGSDVFEREDFYEVAMDAFVFEGEQTCLPQNISSLVTYYNKDLFAEASVPEPTAGWTWDEMVERALALTRDTDGDGTTDVYGLGAGPSVIRIAPFVWSNGGEIVDDPDRPTRFTLDTPEAQEALQAFFDLRLVHQVIPDEQEVESEDDESRFLNGGLAMVLSSRRSTPLFRTITDFTWDVAPLPVFDEQAGILHADAYCLTEGSEKKGASWTFAEFALGPEGQAITAASGRTVPSLIEVSTSEAFLDPSADPASSQVFIDTIPVIRRVPSISTWPEIEEAAEQLLELGLYEGVPASEVARSIDDATRSIFARARA